MVTAKQAAQCHDAESGRRSQRWVTGRDAVEETGRRGSAPRVGSCKWKAPGGAPQRENVGGNSERDRDALDGEPELALLEAVQRRVAERCRFGGCIGS